jgi:modulator of FtsH protease HflK
VARDDEEPLTTDERVRRSVARTLGTWSVVVVSLAVIVGWAATGFYTLQPDEAAVILRLGAFDRTVQEPGWHWLLPPPFETKAIVNYTQVRREKFGLVPGESPRPGEETATAESAIQTGDSNIVNLSYEVQYRLKDPYSYVYGMAEPEATLRDAAQAAVRQVVGKGSIDDVLAEGRGQVQRETRRILQTTMDSYFADQPRHEGPFEIESVNLLVVQPPAEVQAAFDDVVAARQDQARSLSQARGDAREIVERANGEAIEVRQAADAYKQSQIFEASGRAQRFEALLAEYRRAPDVTRQRLYLETMESVLPGVEKVIVEPGTVQLMPLLPLGPSFRAPPPVAAPAPAPPPATAAPREAPAAAPQAGPAPEPKP